MRCRVFAGLLGVLCAGALLTSCTPSHSKCSMAPTAGTFVGTLIERRGSTATFRVVRVVPDGRDASPIRPEAGRLAVVRYERHEEQFLRTGDRYLVTVWPDPKGNGFFSSVHMANHDCSGGTVHADGSAIDTSLRHQPHLHHVVFAFAAVLAALALLVGAWMAGTRRRQRRAVEALRRSAS